MSTVAQRHKAPSPHRSLDRCATGHIKNAADLYVSQYYSLLLETSLLMVSIRKSHHIWKLIPANVTGLQGCLPPVLCAFWISLIRMSDSVRNFAWHLSKGQGTQLKFMRMLDDLRSGVHRK